MNQPDNHLLVLGSPLLWLSAATALFFVSLMFLHFWLKETSSPASELSERIEDLEAIRNGTTDEEYKRIASSLID